MILRHHIFLSHITLNTTSQDSDPTAIIASEDSKVSVPFTAAPGETLFQADIPERLTKSLSAPQQDELEKESDWIAGILAPTLSHHQISVSGAAQNLQAALRCVRQEHFDLPYLYTYRQERYDSAVLSKELLWEALRLDREWPAHFQRLDDQKRRLQLAGAAGQWAYLRDFVVKSAAELQDVERFLDFHAAAEAGKKEREDKRPDDEMKKAFSERQMEVARRTALGLGEFAAKFSLDPEGFNENLSKGGTKTVLPPHQSLKASIMAKDFICPRMADEYAVIQETVAYLAAEIAATQPLLRRMVREVMLKFGEISTCPTAVGSEKLDVFSPSYRAKRIQKRPLHTVLDDIWLDINRCEEDGLVTSSILIEPHAYAEMMEKLRGLFCLAEPEIARLPDNEQTIEGEYNDLRKDALDIAIKSIIVPETEQQVREILEQISESYVLKQCVDTFRRRLMHPPTVDPGARHRPVLAVVLDRSGDGRKRPVQTAVINGDGELQGERLVLNLAYTQGVDKLSSMERNQYDTDVEQVKGLIRQGRPRVIVVGADCKEARGVYKMLAGPEFLEDCYGRLESKEVSVRYAKVQNIESLLTSPAAIASSAKSTQSLILRTAVSLARTAQSPLAETLNLLQSLFPHKFSEAFPALALHPLQGLVSKKRLGRALRGCIRDCVNTVGVDLNSVAGHPHMEVLLRYVSGLGRTTAERILVDIKRRGPLSRRVAMLDRRLVREHVYRNCAGFIRIQTESPAYETDPSHDWLDTTRIHPDFYPAVKSLAVKALQSAGIPVPPEQADNINTMVATVRSAPDSASPVERYVASMTESDQKDREFCLQILPELNSPFSDPRGPPLDMSSQELGMELEQEDMRELFVGKIVTVTVARREGSRLVCQLHPTSSLEATIALDPAADEAGKYTPGEELTARIAAMDSAPDNGELKITLSIKERDLRSHEGWVRLNPQDRTWFYIDPNDLETNVRSRQQKEEVTKSQPEEPQQHQKYVPREINYPHFFNVSMSRAMEYLTKKDMGEFLFRPSSQGMDHLTLSLKFYVKTYVHIDIREECKAPGAPIGSKLVIGDDRFDSLEDIVNDYIKPVMERVKDLDSHRKFVGNTRLESLTDYVAMDQKRNPNVISYSLGIVPEYPQYVVMAICPRAQKTITEFIKVKPKGLYFHDKYHSSLNALIEWFKQNFTTDEYQRYLRRRNRPPTLQVHPSEPERAPVCDVGGEEIPEKMQERGMETMYLPGTEYQRPAESVLDTPIAPASVYEHTLQFSTYVESEPKSISLQEPGYSQQPYRQYGGYESEQRSSEGRREGSFGRSWGTGRRSSPPRRGGPVRCFNCGEEGHRKFDCPQLAGAGGSRRYRGGGDREFREPERPRFRARRGGDRDWGHHESSRGSSQFVWGGSDRGESSMKVLGVTNDDKDPWGQVATESSKPNEGVAGATKETAPAKPAVQEAAGAWGGADVEELKREPEAKKDVTSASKPSVAAAGSPGSDDFKQFNTVDEPKIVVMMPEDNKQTVNTWDEVPANDKDSSKPVPAPATAPAPAAPIAVPEEEKKEGPTPAWGGGESVSGEEPRRSRRFGGGGRRGDSWGHSDSRSGGMRCYNCDEEGHMSRDCPRKSARGGRGMGRGRGGDNVCYNCHQPGHISRDCPEPRQERGGRARRSRERSRSGEREGLGQSRTEGAAWGTAEETRNEW